MKAFCIIALALVAAGCAPASRFAHDPRAAVVGPEYLDDIVEFPRDRITQYYYPVFTVDGLTNGPTAYSSESHAQFGQGVDALLIDLPEPSEAAKEATGKGWPELQRKGIAF